MANPFPGILAILKGKHLAAGAAAGFDAEDDDGLLGLPLLLLLVLPLLLRLPQRLPAALLQALLAALSQAAAAPLLPLWMARCSSEQALIRRQWRQSFRGARDSRQ